MLLLTHPPTHFPAPEAQTRIQRRCCLSIFDTQCTKVSLFFRRSGSKIVFLSLIVGWLHHQSWVYLNYSANLTSRMAFRTNWMLQVPDVPLKVGHSGLVSSTGTIWFSLYLKQPWTFFSHNIKLCVLDLPSSVTQLTNWPNPNGLSSYHAMMAKLKSIGKSLSTYTLYLHEDEMDRCVRFNYQHLMKCLVTWPGLPWHILQLESFGRISESDISAILGAGRIGRKTRHWQHNQRHPKAQTHAGGPRVH